MVRFELCHVHWCGTFRRAVWQFYEVPGTRCDRLLGDDGDNHVTAGLVRDHVIFHVNHHLTRAWLTFNIPIHKNCEHGIIFTLDL